MEHLTELLDGQRDLIEQQLYLGNVHWKDLVRKLRTQECSAQGTFRDEQVWTFLVGCGYAISGPEGLASITNILTGADLPQPDGAKIWMEVLPLPPRMRERNTRVDLAIGHVVQRGKTKSGIKLERSLESWICFCEMKWCSDIDKTVTHDPNRNQLARVIENALCFQDDVRYSDEIHVALVTPAKFKRPNSDCKAYQEVFRRYESDRVKLQNDLDACQLEKRDRSDWKYPVNIDDRICSLNLTWPTYDQLFSELPTSAISEGLQLFWENHSNIL